MYLRFVCSERDADSQVAAGIFCAAYRLRARGALDVYEYEWLTEVLHWFDEHLESPTRFKKSVRPPAPSRGVCWFKPTAREHLARAHELASLLEGHGVFIRRLKVARAGLVVYEDAHQVVAVPFADMGLR